ncbi:hypothetical protein BHE90_013672 [Fusarium euwallaceae]|uniref:Amidohydrolase-related domain-containing protein n=1 Tax=Fusarium euwallaceae TaxID=1147111 RepID=A0A430L845_9HYPO|nr:hypothetical protein BHE90_013672 [Fusarium euwallaceae]
MTLDVLSRPWLLSITMRTSLLSAFWAATFVLRALSKSILFEQGAVITYDEETQSVQVKRNHSVLIEDDRVTAIFDLSKGNVSIPPDTEVIYAGNDIISPGFIDTHRHVWQTVQRSLGGDSCLAQYLGRWSRFSLAARAFTPDVMYYSQLAGLCEALNGGVTSIVDNASGAFTQAVSDASIRATEDSGIRSFHAYHIRRGIEGFAFEDQLVHYQNLSGQFDKKGGLVSLGLAYETFDTGDSADTEVLINLARSSNTTFIQTHFVGGPLGLENSPSLLAKLDLLNGSFPVIFVHGNSVTLTDANLLRRFNHYISMAPEFEMHHGQDNFNPSLVQDQAALSVGTHYSTSGDIITQARIWLQSVRQQIYQRVLRDFQFPANNPMSTKQAFHLATRAGGLALRRPDLGVIRVGAKADIAVFDGSAPGLLGWEDAITAVVLHSNIGHIKHVLVNGEWRKRDGQLYCALNETAVQGEFLKAAQAVRSFWSSVEEPVFEGEAPGTGALYRQIEKVDVVRGSLDGY